MVTWVARAEIGSIALLRALAFTQEFALEAAGLALAVSVFAGDFVSAGAGLLPESPVFESPDFESPAFDSLAEESLLDELSDESLDELLFDA